MGTTHIGVRMLPLRRLEALEDEEERARTDGLRYALRQQVCHQASRHSQDPGQQLCSLLAVSRDHVVVHLHLLLQVANIATASGPLGYVGLLGVPSCLPNAELRALAGHASIQSFWQPVLAHALCSIAALGEPLHSERL